MYLFIKEPVSDTDDDDDKRLTHFKTRAAKGLARVKIIKYCFCSICYVKDGGRGSACRLIVGKTFRHWFFFSMVG